MTTHVMTTHVMTTHVMTITHEAVDVVFFVISLVVFCCPVTLRLVWRSTCIVITGISLLLSLFVLCPPHGGGS